MRLKRHGWWTDFALACVSAVLLIPSFPNFDVSRLAWVGLIPLLVALDGKRPGRAFLLSFTSGLILFHGIFSWIFVVTDFNLLDQVLLASYLCCYAGVFGLLVAWIRKRTALPFIVTAPPLWVALEYLRAHAGFLSLPWMLLGYTQYRDTALIQVTSLTGIYGLSFLIVLTNALGADAICYWRNRQRAFPAPAPTGRRMAIYAASVCAVLGGTYLYGHIVLSQPPSNERMNVAVVQGNIPQQGASRQSVIDRYTRLTREAARSGPDLIVWPETAAPGDLKHDRRLQQTIGALARETETFLLVGSSQYAKLSTTTATPRAPESTKFYNSMLLLSPEGRIEGEYRKIVLIPFGEYEPLRGVIKWPKAIASNFGQMLPGDSYTLLSVGERRFGAAICWEIIFPDVFRELVAQGATFMVNATNESWFGRTAVPDQLLATATIRAAENRVSIARAANTAHSAFIDPHGRITQRLRGPAGDDLFVEGILSHDVQLSHDRTFYTTYGDVFAFAQIALSFALLLRCWLPLPVRVTNRVGARA